MDTFEDGRPGLAAQLAFYFLLALFPALLIVVSLLAYVDAGPLVAGAVTELEGLLAVAGARSRSRQPRRGHGRPAWWTHYRHGRRDLEQFVRVDRDHHP